jgi:hypothetical protein
VGGERNPGQAPPLILLITPSGENQEMDMTVLRIAALAAVAATLAACGHNGEQRAATGAAAGAVVAGPVGAAVGGAAGAIVNKVDKAN